MPGASCWYKPQCLLPVVATEWECWGSGGELVKMKRFGWWETRTKCLYIYIHFGLLSGSICWEGAENGCWVNHNVITLSHTHCGCTLHPVSSIIRIKIRCPPQPESRLGGTTNHPTPSPPSSPTFTLAVFRSLVRATLPAAGVCSRRGEMQMIESYCKPNTTTNHNHCMGLFKYLMSPASLHQHRWAENGRHYSFKVE